MLNHFPEDIFSEDFNIPEELLTELLLTQAAVLLENSITERSSVSTEELEELHNTHPYLFGL